MIKRKQLSVISLGILFAIACNDGTNTTDSTKNYEHLEGKKPISEPLVSHIYTADPSAHVFNNRIYIYPSHDTATGVNSENDNGDHFDMRDYRILSMDSIGGKVTEHGVALSMTDVPWVGRQMWAPDAAEKDGKYFLYFPAKDKEDIFRIGVAVSDKPEGPFTPQPNPIKGSYSMDPTVFKDDDGTYYMYFGGIWGGQLQNWNSNNEYTPGKQDRNPEDFAVLPRIAKMDETLLEFAEAPKEIQIVDENGNLFKEKDNDKRFFEAAWIHKYNGKYYLSYSTGDTHLICYAVGDNPYGPFTYKGIILNPVVGWTNHHSITSVNGKWYLFYHDVQLSGKTWLRNVKVTELKHREDGSIETINPYY